MIPIKVILPIIETVRIFTRNQASTNRWGARMRQNIGADRKSPIAEKLILEVTIFRRIFFGVTIIASSLPVIISDPMLRYPYPKV